MPFLDSFHVVLPSGGGTSLFTDNTTTHYRTKLGQRLILEGDNWEVGLSEFNCSRPIKKNTKSRSIGEVSKGEALDVQYDTLYFFYYPVYIPPPQVTFEEAVPHLLEFLNSVLKPVVGRLVNVFSFNDRDNTISAINPSAKKITISQSLARFLHLIPKIPSQKALGTSDWDSLPFKVFESMYMDSDWWVSIGVTSAKLTVRIPPNFYDSPESLVDAINPLIKGNVSDFRRVRFSFNPSSKKISINFPTPYWIEKRHDDAGRFEIFSVKLNDSLAELLGFEPGKTYGEFTREGNFTLDYEPPWVSFRIFSDIVRDGLIGEKLSPLLRSIHAKDDGFINMIFIKPEYKQLTRTNLESISISIADHLNQPLPPSWAGYVSVTLHFRHRMY